MIGLTRQQARLLAFLREFIGREGVPPSFEEMRAYLGYAGKSCVHALVVALEERGHIRRLKLRARAIELIDAPGNPFSPATTAKVLRLASRLGATPDVLVQTALQNLVFIEEGAAA